MPVNDFWDEYDDHEVLVVIRGHQERHDLWGRTLAHFFAHNINAQRSKRDKRVEAEKLWESLEKRAGKEEARVTDPGEVRRRQGEALERAERLPTPKKLRRVK